MEKKINDKFIGNVRWYSQEKGFGFISTDNAGDIFVYYADIISDGFKTLEKGQTVRFEMVQGERGPQAANVTVD